MQEIKQVFKPIGLTEIEEHAKKYEEIMIKKREEYWKKQEEIQAARNQHALQAASNISYRSIFRERLIQEDRDFREQDYQRKEFRRQMNEKMLHYYNYVKEAYIQQNDSNADQSEHNILKVHY